MSWRLRGTACRFPTAQLRPSDCRPPRPQWLVVFDGIYKKLERELHEKKKEMAAIIEDSKNAYQLRDKSQVPQPPCMEHTPVV